MSQPVYLEPKREAERGKRYSHCDIVVRTAPSALFCCGQVMFFLLFWMMFPNRPDLGKSSLEKRWFVLKRPRRDINGGSETGATVTSRVKATRTSSVMIYIYIYCL